MPVKRRDRTVGFLPRHEPLPTACASCPFRRGNDAEFGAVIQRLRAKGGLGLGPPKLAIIANARVEIRRDVVQQGPEFTCHGTAYDQDMNPRPASEHRQCPGAIAFEQGHAFYEDKETT